MLRNNSNYDTLIKNINNTSNVDRRRTILNSKYIFGLNGFTYFRLIIHKNNFKIDESKEVFLKLVNKNMPKNKGIKLKDINLTFIITCFIVRSILL